jgi:hypothetical protein
MSIVDRHDIHTNGHFGIISIGTFRDGVGGSAILFLFIPEDEPFAGVEKSGSGLQYVVVSVSVDTETSHRGSSGGLHKPLALFVAAGFIPMLLLSSAPPD